MNIAGAVLSRDEILEAAERIDPLPASVIRLLELSSDPNVEIAEVADVIRYDPVLTVDLLKRVNSAMSSSRSTITDVSDAVMRLGTSDVLIMAMKRAMQGKLSQPIAAYGLEGKALWHHSLAATVGAEVIMQQSSIRVPSAAATAALLHDVGKLVIADCIASSTIEHIVASAQSQGRRQYELEREILGADHGEIGASVLRGWGFPLSMQMALTRHHDIDENTDTVSHVVVAANVVAHVLLDPRDEEESISLTEQDMRSFHLSGMSQDGLPQLFQSAFERFTEVMATYES